MLNDLRNTVYLFVINKSLNETAKRIFNDEDRRSGRKFGTLYIFYWAKESLNLRFNVSFIDLHIHIYLKHKNKS